MLLGIIWFFLDVVQKDNPEITEEVTKKTCVGSCSNHGTCKGGRTLHYLVCEDILFVELVVWTVLEGLGWMHRKSSEIKNGIYM